MDNEGQQSRYSRTGGLNPRNIIYLVIIVIIIVVPTLYFTLWKPSDNDIANAQTATTALQSDSSDMVKQLSGMTHPVELWPNSIDQFKSKSDDYQTNLSSLLQSHAITHSFGESGFTSSRDTLSKFGDSVKNLASSLMTFKAIDNACSGLMSNSVITTVSSHSAFTKASADCTVAINNGKTVPDSNFSEQFYTQYHQYANDMLSALDGYFSAHDKADKAAVTSNLAKYYDTVVKVSQMSSPIKYGIIVPSSATFDTISNALNSEKSSFIR
ncbi:MAG: hypothetical protein JWO07_613 [Candidatus Saccharibacteria bacterium]|nr:hypothetical protein [Candidatus Saccharibacteria bacterium]